MQPNDRRDTNSIIPQRQHLSVTGHTPQRQSDANVNDAAASIVRHQLDAIYSGQTTTPTPQTTPVPQSTEPAQQSLESSSPYSLTQTTNTSISTDQWKQYHSAWQDYYQKYYERYYVGQVYRARQVLEEKARDAATSQTTQPQPTATPMAPATEQAEATFSRDEALYDLRAKLRRKVHSQAQKARRSRHFIPIVSALAVMLLFVILQYNSLIVANIYAYTSPGNVDPANIIVDPSTTVAISDEPKLIIPKINVDVPVNWNTTPDHDSQMKGMENGVAWFGIPGANSRPGQVGNTVLSGHSSNQWTDPGQYKFIFVRLDDLTKNDTVYINYEGTRYTYSVTKKEVVKPTEVNKLVYETDKPVLTLITCTPIGTATNRLLVTAEQISPNPNEAKAAPENSGDTSSVKMPGNSPTLLERLFGLGD